MKRIQQVWMAVFMVVMAAFLAVPALATDLSQVQSFGSDWEYPKKRNGFPYVWQGDITGQNRNVVKRSQNSWYPSLTADGRYMMVHYKGQIIVKDCLKGTKKNFGKGKIGGSINANGSLVVFQRENGELVLAENKRNGFVTTIAWVDPNGFAFPRIGYNLVTYEDWVTLYLDPTTGKYREWNCEVDGPPCYIDEWGIEWPYPQWGVMRVFAIDTFTWESWTVDTSEPMEYNVWGHEVSPDDRYILNIRAPWTWDLGPRVCLYDVASRTSEAVVGGSRALWLPDASGFVFYNDTTSEQEVAYLDGTITTIGSGWIMAEDYAFKPVRRR